MAWFSFAAWRRIYKSLTGTLLFECMFHNEYRFKEKDKEALGRYLKRCDTAFLPYQDPQSQIAALWPDPKMRWLKCPLWLESYKNSSPCSGQCILSPRGGQSGGMRSSGSLNLPLVSWAALETQESASLWDPWTVLLGIGPSPQNGQQRPGLCHLAPLPRNCDP